MSHSHLIIGHITTTTVKIWVRAGSKDKFKPPAELRLKVIDVLSGSQVHTDSVILHNDASFGCHVFEVNSLNPEGENNKKYLVQVDVSLRNGKTHSLNGKFRTTPVTPEPFSFFLGSCYFSQGKDYKSPEYRSLRKWEAEKQPLFMMNAGDQIYIDTIQGSLEIFGRALFKYKKKDYVNRYLDTWYAKDTRKFLSSLPQYMILDDHEIYNNFKIPPPSKKRKNASFSNAKSVYRQFQHSRNPDTEGDETFYYDFDVGDTSFFVFDVRTEKTEDLMISESQMARFSAWVHSRRNVMKFVVTPVPLISQLVSNSDKWSDRAYRAQRNEILQTLIEAACPKVLFLTGDIHLACHSKISFENDGQTWAFHELASSPIKQLQAWILDRETKILSGNVINGEDVDFRYQLFYYMGKKGNHHNAGAYSLQNNAMNISWDPERGVVRYESLKINSKRLETIFSGEIDFA